MKITMERLYQELKDLNEKYGNLNISNARGEEELKGIHKEFQTLNGSVKKHEKRIGKIEKIIYLVLGGAGTLSILWTIFTHLT